MPSTHCSASSKQAWRVLTVILLAISMSLMSVSIVNVALASIQQGLNASQASIQWVLSGYALTFGLVLVSAGRAGDLMGRGGFFLVGVLIFTLASIGAGLAADTFWLNFSRFVQGIGSGLLNPQGMGMIQQYFQGAARGKAFGYFGASVGVSVALGPILGGFLIEAGGPELGWRLTFLINLPLGILTLVLGYLWLPKPLIHKPKVKGTKQQTSLASLDPVGALLLGLAVLAVLLPFVEMQLGLLGWLLLPLGLLLLYAWVKWERFYSFMGLSPMVDLNIFKLASFRNGLVIMGLYFFGMTSVWVLIPLYLQLGEGFSAMHAGAIGIPSALLSAVSSTWAGKKVHYLGRKVVIGGILCALTGLLLSLAVIYLHAQFQTSLWWLLASLALFGLGQGAVISPNQTLTLAEVPLDYAGSSGAIMQTGQRIGTSIGLALITALVFSLLKVTSWALAVSLGLASVVSILLLVLYLAVQDLRLRHKSNSA